VDPQPAPQFACGDELGGGGETFDPAVDVVVGSVNTLCSGARLSMALGKLGPPGGAGKVGLVATDVAAGVAGANSGGNDNGGGATSGRTLVQPFDVPITFGGGAIDELAGAALGVATPGGGAGHICCACWLAPWAALLALSPICVPVRLIC
jgi:hypothetical protein